MFNCIWLAWGENVNSWIEWRTDFSGRCLSIILLLLLIANEERNLCQKKRQLMIINSEWINIFTLRWMAIFSEPQTIYCCCQVRFTKFTERKKIHSGAKHIFLTRESSNFNHFDMTTRVFRIKLNQQIRNCFYYFFSAFVCCTVCFTQMRIHEFTLPVSSRSLSGLRFSTELRFDGIGKLGFGRFFKAARACCTASWRTSILCLVQFRWDGQKTWRIQVDFV